MISESKREEIRKVARRMLDEFGSALAKVKEKAVRDEKSESYREEKDGGKASPEFRKAMFDNASKKDDDCIIAEKKKW